MQGLYGMRYQNTDKIIFCNKNCQPKKIGVSVMRFVSLFADSSLIERFHFMKRKPLHRITPRNVRDTSRGGDCFQGTTHITATDVYNKIRDIGQDILTLFPKYSLVDDLLFLTNSELVDIGYIINIDSKMMELYSGINTDINARGRYNISACLSKEYYGIRLVDEIPFDYIRNHDIKKIGNIWDKMTM